MGRWGAWNHIWFLIVVYVDLFFLMIVASFFSPLFFIQKGFGPSFMIHNFIEITDYNLFGQKRFHRSWKFCRLDRFVSCLSLIENGTRRFVSFFCKDFTSIVRLAWPIFHYYQVFAIPIIS